MDSRTLGDTPERTITRKMTQKDLDKEEEAMTLKKATNQNVWIIQ
jgi:hypothetical protein